MLFVCHPQILHKHCLQFLLGVKWPQEQLKTMLKQKCGMTKKALWYVAVFSVVVNMMMVADHKNRWE